MRAIPARVGARVCDSLPFSQSGTAEQARALKAAGVDGMACYLGVLTKERLGFILDAGMAYVPVTLAGEYVDGAIDELSQLANLGIPKETTVFLDMEGKASLTSPATGLVQIASWGSAIVGHGYTAGLYVGTPQPFTSTELYGPLANITRYWRGQGRIVDRFGKLAEPTCGWCMTQVWPSVAAAGLLVDHNMTGQDYWRRSLNWVVA